jgi:tetratricopeptide (TPR) repeat protein
LARAPDAGLGAAWDAWLRPGAVVGRFELVREVGRGGFGVVYEAKDRDLGRSVAFKAVHAGGRTALREERLLREAEAAARLSHPNIVTLHDLGRCEQGPYLVMEMLRGETLEQRLEQGPLPLREAVRIGVEVAKGLAHAHAQGVFHRDLKPGNVFLCEGGQVKVLDFGLAHAFGRRRAEGGTPAYMAPEQWRGAPEDERTDVFALGVILFQMLARELPFQDGKAIQGAKPAPALDVPKEPALGELIARMLSKDPTRRPRDAGEVLSALDVFQREMERTAGDVSMPVRKRTRTGLRLAALLAPGLILGAGVAALAIRRSPGAPNDGRIIVAVADFANETEDRELNGLSGLLITSLEQSKRLVVLTRTKMIDVLRQAGHANVERIDEVLGQQVARQAGARAFLVAAIHHFGQSYTVELRALDPQRDAYLFTVKEMAASKAAIPDLIDRLADHARRELRESADDVAASRIRVARAVTGSLEAYEHYFRGVQFQEGARYEEAIAEYRKATQIDPAFALAHYRIAYAGFFAGLPWAAIVTESEAANVHADKAPEKERLLIQAWKAKLDNRNAEAVALNSRAVSLYPDDKQVSFMAGEHLYHWGRFAESLPHFERAVALDPTWEWARYHIVDDLLLLGRYAEALDRARVWVADKPDTDTHRWLSRALFVNRRWAEAEEAGRRALAMAEHAGPFSWGAYWSRFAVLDALIWRERYEEAEELLRPVVDPKAKASDRARGVPAMAEVLSYQGRRREALQLIDGLRGAGASDANRLGLRIYHLLGAGVPIRHELEEAVRLGVPARQLAVPLAMAGDLDGARMHAAELDPESPERALFEAVAAWRQRDLTGAASRFTALLGNAALDYAPFSRLALGEIAFASRRDADAVALLESYGNSAVVCLRQSPPPPEIFRAFFAGYLRSWAYPRSLYLRALAHERLGERATARETIDHLLAIWKRADPDIPLLSEAKALRKRLESLMQEK